jgi:hypothetical protein
MVSWHDDYPATFPPKEAVSQSRKKVFDLLVLCSEVRNGRGRFGWDTLHEIPADDNEIGVRDGRLLLAISVAVALQRVQQAIVRHKMGGVAVKIRDVKYG